MAQEGGRTGSRFGPYELRTLLGRGGMGEVYEAHDTIKDRVVALKLLPESLANDADFRERFRREARTAARLQEPHVIPIHDFGEIDGVLYIDMRLVRGRDLKSIVKDGPLGTARSLALISQVASALDAAHTDGLVHRDIKPENVMVTPDDFAYLADFGIAATEQDTRLTGTGSAIGSIAYMAPERFREGAISGAADIYALGCLLHECLTGQTPYRPKTVSAQIAAHLYDPPPAVSKEQPGTPAGLDGVVAKALAKQPADRYATAGELAAAARAAASSQDQSEATTIIQRSGSSAGAAGAAVAASSDQQPTQSTPLPGTSGYGGGPSDWAAGATASAASYGGPAAGYPSTGAQPAGAPAQENRGLQRAWWVAAACAALAAIVIGVVLITQMRQDSNDGEPGAAAASSPVDPSGAAEQPSSAAASTPPAEETSSEESSAPDESSSSESSSSEPSSDTSKTSTSEKSSSTSSEPEFSGSGYGHQGWKSSSAARCNADDPAVTVGRTAKTYLVICRSNASGGHYYRAYRTTGGGATEIQHPRTSGDDGWVVTKNGYIYRITSTALKILDPKGKAVSEEDMLQYRAR